MTADSGIAASLLRRSCSRAAGADWQAAASASPPGRVANLTMTRSGRRRGPRHLGAARLSEAATMPAARSDHAALAGLAGDAGLVRCRPRRGLRPGAMPCGWSSAGTIRPSGRAMSAPSAEGIWGVMLIIATGEHGDRDTPRVLKRLIVGIMWLFGVVLIAQFTATVTATLTVERIRRPSRAGRPAGQGDRHRARQRRRGLAEARWRCPSCR